jgi:hypothetical protein
VSPTLTPEQRDLLYGQILIRLSGIGDVWLAAESKNFETANRLGREFADDLLLVLDDLGWGEGTGEPIELTTPPDVLRRAVERIHGLVVAQDRDEAGERAELRRTQEENRQIREACESVLAALGEDER